MSQLEDVMNQYEPNEDILKKAGLGESPLSAKERQAILQKTLIKAGLQSKSLSTSKSTGIPKKKLWPFAIACILMLAMGSIAIAAIVLDKDFVEFFKPTKQEQVDSLNQAGAALDAEATNNGLTVKMRQIIGDSYNMYVLFDVIAPAGMVLNKDECLFISPYVTVDGVNSLGYNFETIDDQPNDNRLSMILVLNGSKELVGKQAHLKLKDFGHYNMASTSQEVAGQVGDNTDTNILVGEDGDNTDPFEPYTTLVAGEWNLDFTLKYNSMSVQHKLDKDVDIWGNECKIKEMEVSPLGVTLIVEGQGLTKYDNEPLPTDGSAGFFTELKITLKDGASVPINSGGSSFNGNRIVINYQLGNVISIDDIASITFKGQEILAK